MTKKEAKSIKLGEKLSKFTNKEFVNEQGKIIKADELIFIGKGENSSVWKYEKADEIYAFKIFFEACKRFSLKNESCERLKKVELQRIINVVDGFYEKNTDSLSRKELDAYLMTYLVEEKEQFLINMPTSILLENAQLLEEDAHLLAENGIQMGDIKMQNSIILQNYELFFTDVDMYEVNYLLTKKEIFENNKIEIKFFFKRYLLEELATLKILTNEEFQKVVSKIYSLQRLNELKVREYLEEMLGGYETPKEYFLSRN